jgi:hypothetical protein
MAWWNALAVFTATLLASVPAWAQGGGTDTLYLRIGVADTVMEYRGEAVADGGAIRAQAGHDVLVRVTGASSALYRCTLTQDTIPGAALDTVRSFLASLGPYLPELATELAEGAMPARPAAPPDALTEAAARQLAAVDSLLHGPAGLSAASSLTLRALDALARGETSSGDVARSPRSSLAGTGACDADCRRLSLASRMLTAFQGLDTLLMALHQDPQAPKAATTAVTAALKDEAKALDAAYGLEALVRVVLAGSDAMDCGRLSLEPGSARRVGVALAPRREREVARIVHGTLERRVRVLPDRLIRPAVSVSFMWAPGQKYATFGARTAGGVTAVDTAGVSDRTFTYGLTLSTTWRGLDGRDRNRFTLWIPELTINPTDDVRAVALGAGISYAIIKLGTGLVWTRHATLSGVSIGDPLEKGESPRTRETYGGGGWYVSVAVVGWPPFLPGGKP